MSDYTVYGASHCVWCKRARDILEMFGKNYSYIDVGDSEKMDGLRARLPGVRTIPQVFCGDRHVGGYEALVAELEDTSGGFGEGGL